ncbi:MAG: RecQ family ATP-dependent DNA helicase, partial [Defluviitaleaceae bacterium]|nr:RecQ family ATP-dependent DNA helicase [Defluviitaleaceae bacterium]
MLARDLLRQYFGYEDFRPGQCEIIDDILAGRDVLGIMPTGAGKSMCFQIPALMMDGITIVISPLISLMKDQVNSLTQNGIAAAFINSSLTDSQMRRALDGCANGTYKLVYVAPERLFAGDFLAFAQNTNISMLTVDEAHCISQWGQDFRPSYTAIARFAGLLPRRPVVSAFTATATPIVRDDIAALLALQNPRLLISGFDRPNLHFEVRKPADKYAELLGFIGNKRELSGIIYCNSRALVEELCDKLILDGLMASRYHAGLPDSERRNNQDDFLFDRARIMVATNAFGMGIDKSNVSYVVHYNMPKDIEAYYQEAGRAGRDGHPADCLLMHGGRDMQTNLWFIEQSAHEHLDAETERLLKERNFRRLQDMAMYCETSECLRGYILRYFGESPPADCGNCANCRGDFEMANITIEAQKVLSCVVRMRERFGAG